MRMLYVKLPSGNLLECIGKARRLFLDVPGVAAWILRCSLTNTLGRLDSRRVPTKTHRRVSGADSRSVFPRRPQCAFTLVLSRARPTRSERRRLGLFSRAAALPRAPPRQCRPALGSASSCAHGLAESIRAALGRAGDLGSTPPCRPSAATQHYAKEHEVDLQAPAQAPESVRVRSCEIYQLAHWAQSGCAADSGPLARATARRCGTERRHLRCSAARAVPSGRCAGARAPIPGLSALSRPSREFTPPAWTSGSPSAQRLSDSAPHTGEPQRAAQARVGAFGRADEWTPDPTATPTPQRALEIHGARA
ncbi:hypothetical protein B0H10DRAFT_2433894 [Mycena sp. CBHHK59/15]|nr:hypothetical protein B0H10DRAFT_2433894 [Mycena sp. CBHHK59/15]